LRSSSPLNHFAKLERLDFVSAVETAAAASFAA
jgi:hypothetical protein